jgi:hypothetical protein
MNPEEKSDTEKDENARDPNAETYATKQPSPGVKEGNALAAIRLPKDRYVAPGMESWTKIFRFGHQLLIPTYVNDSKAMLFMIDTGSFANILSTRAARPVTKVDTSRTQVRGLNGSVGKVYSGEKATLTFSRFRQNNLDIVTIDLSNLCRHTGTEVSGILGFNVLRLLEIKIDYRDGLVDFYHPNIPPPRD